MYYASNLKDVLLDQYKKYLGVSVIPTYRCNFHCKTCCETLTNDPSRVDQVLKLSDLKDFIEFLKKVNTTLSNDEAKFNWILLTGGEVTTLPFDYIKQTCDLVHNCGFRVSMATNGSKREKLLELDGFLDRIVMSHHSKKPVMPDWVNSFKTTNILVSKLIDKKSFPTRESFEKFVNEIIKKMCNVAHDYGFKTSMFTNGSAGKKLLELDGCLNQMVISHHSKQPVMPKWASSFKKTEIVINKLVDKESFPIFLEFDNFVEEIIKANVNYRQKFSTYGYNTPEFKEHYPDWVDTAFKKVKTFTNYSKRVIYKGMEFKFSEFSCMISRTFIQHPNGNVNTTWENDFYELNYRNLSECYSVRKKLEKLNENFKKIALLNIPK